VLFIDEWWCVEEEEGWLEGEEESMVVVVVVVMSLPGELKIDFMGGSLSEDGGAGLLLSPLSSLPWKALSGDDT